MNVRAVIAWAVLFCLFPRRLHRAPAAIVLRPFSSGLWEDDALSNRHPLGRLPLLGSGPGPGNPNKPAQSLSQLLGSRTVHIPRKRSFRDRDRKDDSGIR